MKYRIYTDFCSQWKAPSLVIHDSVYVFSPDKIQLRKWHDVEIELKDSIKCNIYVIIHWIEVIWCETKNANYVETHMLIMFYFTHMLERECVCEYLRCGNA